MIHKERTVFNVRRKDDGQAAYRSKVKVTENENVKSKSSFFAHIFVKSKSIYNKKTPK